MSRRAALVLVLVAVAAWLVWLFVRDSPAEQADVAAPRKIIAVREKEAPRERRRDVDSAPSPAKEALPAPVPVAPVAEGPTIAGRVTDADGAPVAGARVVSNPDDLGKLDSSRVGAEGSRTFSVKTDGDGRFEIRVDPKTVQAVLTVDADAGFGQASARPKDRDVAIKLAKWTLLTGKVTDVAKKPIAGARVTAHLLLDALVEDHATVSDADGNYRIERLPPIAWTPDLPFVGRGRHGWIVAEADEYAPLLKEFQSPAVTPTNAVDSKKFDLVLVRGNTLAGKVVDGDTKAPIEGATVVYWSVEGMVSYGSADGASISNPWGQRPLGETRSAADGTFRVEHLPGEGPNGVRAGRIAKRGRSLGQVAAWKDGYVFGGEEIPAGTDEQTIESTIELWPAATATGRVVDGDGKPVEGANVYCDSHRPDLNGFPDFYAPSKTQYATTDAEGRYTLTSFRASRNGPTTAKLAAYVRSPGQYAQSKQVDVTVAAGATVAAPDLVIDFGAVPRATLMVVDAAGAPVVGAMVEGSTTRSSLRTGLDGRVAWTSGMPAKTDAPIAAASFVVRAKGFASQKVEFTPTLKSTVEVIVLVRPGARIAGRVVKSDGSPARATVFVADGTKSPDEAFGDGSFQAQMSRQGKFLVYGQTTADADGNFEVVDLPDGPYLVAAQMSSRAPAGFNRQPKQLRDVRPGVAAGTMDLLLTIAPDDAAPTQPLEVSVTDAAGTPVEQAWATATIEGTQFPAQRKDATTLRFEALPVGAATISVRAPGFAPTTLRGIRIDAANQPPRLDVRLKRGVKVRGSLRFESGKLPDGFSFVVSPVGDSAVMGEGGGKVGADGSYEVGGLTPGRWRLLAHRGVSNDLIYVTVGGTITIPDGRDEVVADLTLTIAARISLVVRDPRLPASPYSGGTADPTKDKFGADSRLEVVDGAGVVVWTQSPVYGNVGSSAAVQPGDYVVRLTLSGDAPQEQRCSVKAGETVVAKFPPN